MPLYTLLLSETPPHVEMLTLALPPMTAFLWIVVLTALLIIALWLASQRPPEYVIESHAHSHDSDAHHHHADAHPVETAVSPHSSIEKLMPAAHIAPHAAASAPAVVAPSVNEPAVAAAVETTPVVPAHSAGNAATVTPDDLKIIEGIGPKIAALLNQAGIQTFRQLADIPTSRLDEILTAANLRRLADPGTWPQQAALAAANQWDELKRLQDTLKGGKPNH